MAWGLKIFIDVGISCLRGRNSPWKWRKYVRLVGNWRWENTKDEGMGEKEMPNKVMGDGVGKRRGRLDDKRVVGQMLGAQSEGSSKRWEMLRDKSKDWCIHTLLYIYLLRLNFLSALEAVWQLRVFITSFRVIGESGVNDKLLIREKAGLWHVFHWQSIY